MAQFQFDARQVAPSTGYDIVPAGWYNAMVDESSIKPTNDGTGTLLNVRYNILDGQYQGRKIFGRFNIRNANAMAQEIAYRDLSALAHSVGVLEIQDSEQLHGKALKIKVKVRPAKDGYEESNEITSWKNVNEQVGAVASAPVAAPQMFQAPPQTQNFAPPVHNYAPPQFTSTQQATPNSWGPPPGQANQGPPPAPQHQPPQQPAQAPQQTAWTPPAGQQPWGQQPQPTAPAAPVQTQAPPWAQRS